MLGSRKPEARIHCKFLLNILKIKSKVLFPIAIGILRNFVV